MTAQPPVGAIASDQAMSRDARREALDLFLDDLRRREGRLDRSVEAQRSLALGLLTGSVALGALIATALKDLELPGVSVVLVVLASGMLLATALLAVGARLGEYLSGTATVDGAAEEVAHSEFPRLDTQREELLRNMIDPDPRARELKITDADVEILRRWRLADAMAARRVLMAVRRRQSRAITAAMWSLLLSAVLFGGAFLVRALEG
jgi:hypothetical protein